MVAKKSIKQSAKKRQNTYKAPSRRLLILLFIVFFAAIGSYFILLSRAAAPPKLTWAPPALVNPTTVTLTSSNKKAILDTSKDYIIKISGKITGAGSVNIVGGRNVVLIGGEINHTDTGGEPGKDQRGMYIQNWTGTMHIEGVYISGTTLGEGINIDTRSPGAILQLQNIRVDTVHGSEAGNHADVVQNWGGPTVYRIDRLTGSTDYQGFMVQPIQFSSAMVTKEMDFRNVNITGANTGYKFFRAGGVEKLTFTNVYFQPSASKAKIGYPESDAVFKQVIAGLAPSDFVPAGSVGSNYTSPGYIGVTSTTPTTPTTPPPTTPTTPTTPTVPTVPTTPTTPTVPTTPIIVNPGEGGGNNTGTVSGTVTVQVPSTGSSTVKTEVLVDGVLKEVVTNGDTVAFDTTGLDNGTHSVTIRTTDVNGAIAETSTDIDVSNPLWRQVLAQALTPTGKLVMGAFAASALVLAMYLYNIFPLSLIRKGA